MEPQVIIVSPHEGSRNMQSAWLGNIGYKNTIVFKYFSEALAKIPKLEKKDYIFVLNTSGVNGLAEDDLYKLSVYIREEYPKYLLLIMATVDKPDTVIRIKTELGWDLPSHVRIQPIGNATKFLNEILLLTGKKKLCEFCGEGIIELHEQLCTNCLTPSVEG